MAKDEKTPEQIVQEAFAELKVANDANLKQHDAVLDDKLTKINATLDKFEPMNQQVTLAQTQQKAMQEQLDRVETVLNRGQLGKPEDPKAKENAEYRAAFNRCLRKTADARDPADVAIITKYKNALVRSDDAGAGYLMAPPDVIAEIIKDIILMSPMRTLATVRTIGGPSLKQPKRTAAAGAARRVGEVETRVNTGDPAYGMVEFQAPEMFARAEISQQMLEDSEYDLEGELRSEFSDQFAVKEGAEFLTGVASANQAEGLLVNTAITAVNSGDATKITGNGLILLFYGLKTAYARGASWIMNRSTIGAIRLLKDGDGQYIWLPGITGVQPNTILGGTYVEMPDMPNIGAGTYPVAFGDFKRAYTVVDRIMMSFQADYTTGADNGLVVYRARKRVGGGVRQAEAVQKLCIAA